MGFKPKENTGQRISQQQEMVFSREQLVLIRGSNLSLRFSCAHPCVLRQKIEPKIWQIKKKSLTLQ